ncbi:class I tRNA ligase family protein [Candidatus Peregrinibacteria bacterium]|nr:class I tRNA ligase family protein [Candidatus Peregrinibacteria bacterium]
MDKAYEPKKHEETIHKKWNDAGVFIAPLLKASRTGKPFVIPLPPPNVTGTLHLGHAEMLVVEDIICRYHRMKGDAVLWLPGTDHAAIATETVVLKNLGIQNRDKEISRKDFLKECWKWSNASHDIITNQVQKMGASCDFSRERFTMDLGLSNAVNTIFTDLFKAGLIYQGHRMINWSVGAQSVLSDDELVWEEREETFYHIRCGEFVIGTVRPETKCADSPVVVNPKDKRYKKLIGKEFEYETYAGKRKFYVLADNHIDPKFGTGAMTISPAHDSNDFEIAKRHHLLYLQKIGFDGRMTKIAGPCAQMTVAEARKKSVEIMRKKGLIVKEEKYMHRVPLCYRTGTVVEPMISKQWFVDVQKEFLHPAFKKKTTLKKLTADAVRKGYVTLIPKRFEKIYFHWIDNLRDWCISRQIWWGHQIPAWYDPNGKIHLAEKQKLLFVRHGESEYNAKNLLAAEHDAPLTEKGKKEAEIFAKKFKISRNIKKIIASPLLRSKSTAEILGKTLNIPVEVWEELREVRAGNLSGTVREAGVSLLERMEQSGEGESLKELESRAKKFWEKVENLTPNDGEILFIGHGVFTALIFAVRDGVLPEYFSEYIQRRAPRIGNLDIWETTLLISPKEKNLMRDQDTLDTWFSAALWPFSTVGWPDETHPDFQEFFPASILETGHDILFFWVARMIMFSLFATGKAPFHTVYLHGLVCDEKGQKMSKSKGNGIDPLLMIEKFGTDALRMSMIVGTTAGNPINLGEKKVEAYRNFANKLWNVARFILMKEEEGKGKQKKGNAPKPKTLLEKWILSRVHRLISEVTDGLNRHRYGEVGNALYQFSWTELADWALESAKVGVSENTLFVLREVLSILVKLLHPYTPFVTEKIWEEMGNTDLLVISEWPKAQRKYINLQAEKNFLVLQNIVTKIRSLRNEKGIDPAQKISVHFSGKNKKILEENEHLLKFLARIQNVSYAKPTSRKGISGFMAGTKIFISFEGAISHEHEENRLRKEIQEVEAKLAILTLRLGNKKYVENAPKHLVEETRTEYEQCTAKIEVLRAEIKR